MDSLPCNDLTRMDGSDPMMPTGRAPFLVACPDARPPAYQAVVGLSQAGRLGEFLTSYYDRGESRAGTIAGKLAPRTYRSIRNSLRRRYHAEIPADRVHSVPSYDLALRLENRLSDSPRHLISRWRTKHFDAKLAETIDRVRPEGVFLFSDVGSEITLPLCRSLGIPTVLSMVHGDVREEIEVLEAELNRSPEFFRLYLGDGALDLEELDWLHERRLRDLELADRVLVPSEHIARALIRHGTPAQKIGVVPYAADTTRFRPDTDRLLTENCTFLFAGGITQRKGIRYLIEAWQKIKRPGWRLQLVGALPRDPGPLTPLLDGVEHLGRVAHSEMPRVMANADVFVFPSLFEGSAVVTYEALASGLPSIVTAAAGSVIRDGVEGFLVPSASVDVLAERMQSLGSNPLLRRAMSHAARSRALDFDWSRYHRSIVAEIEQVEPRPLAIAPPRVVERVPA